MRITKEDTIEKGTNQVSQNTIGKVKQNLFLLPLGLYLLYTILLSSFFAPYIASFYRPTMILCVILLIVKEFFTTHIKLREIIYLAIVLILTWIIYNNLSGQLAILPLFLFIYASRDIDIGRAAKLALIESSILLLVIILSSKLGIIADYIEYSSDRVRHYLGFRYALFPQALLFNITSLDLYIHKDNIKIPRVIFWIIINIIIFVQTGSRLSFYLSIILILGSYIISRYRGFIAKRRVVNILLALSFIICSTITLFTTLNYNQLNNNYVELNNFFGNRLSLGKNAILEYGITLTGNNIQFIGNGLDINGNRSVGNYNYVDSLYVMILLRYGIIFYIIFILMLTATNFYFFKKKRHLLLFIMAIFAMHSMIDDLMIYLYYNTFWLIIGKMIIGETAKKELPNETAKA